MAKTAKKKKSPKKKTAAKRAKKLASKKLPTAPKFNPPANWKKTQLPFKIGSGRNFPDHVLRMAFFTDENNNLVGKVWFGEDLAGPPKHAHGGASAFVLDEAAGSACWAHGRPVVARNIKIEFLRMVPIHTDLNIRAEVVRQEDRDLFVEASIFDNEHVYVKGYGQFAWLSENAAKMLSGMDTSGFDFKKLKYYPS